MPAKPQRLPALTVSTRGDVDPISRQLFAAVIVATTPRLFTSAGHDSMRPPPRLYGCRAAPRFPNRVLDVQVAPVFDFGVLNRCCG